MNSRQFRERITIYKEISKEDDDGFSTDTREEICKVWTAIKTVRGTEYVEAAAIQHENTYRFIIRYRNDIAPYMKIDYKGRVFDIESVLNDDELRKTLTIIAKERV